MDGLKTVALTKRQQVRAEDPEVLVGLGVIRVEYISGTAQITWLEDKVREAMLVWMRSGTVGVSDKGC